MTIIKKFFILLILFLSSYSFGFNLYGNCLAGPAAASCIVSNPSQLPLFCDVYMTGLSSYGTITNSVVSTFIYPFSWQQVYHVPYNSYFNPLISASFVAYCRY